MDNSKSDDIIQNISLLLLAGGKSVRMEGQNKLFLKINNELVLDRTILKLSSISDEIIIVLGYKESNVTKNHLRCVLAKRNISFAEDEINACGPLEGLRVGLKSMKNDWGFVIGCDMPFVDIKTVKYMMGFTNGECDAVAVKIAGHIEPLHAFYNKKCIGEIQKALSMGKRQVKSFFDGIKLKIIEEEEIMAQKLPISSFLNINTPTDLREIENMKKDRVSV